jgi:hypothetical protein
MDEYAYIHTPFALIGISGRSNGVSQLSREDHAESRLFEAESDLPFHEKLVYAPSIEIMVAEAFLQACGGADSLKGVTLDIVRLCEVALQRASPWKRQEVQQAVVKICARNGIAVPPAARAPTPIRSLASSTASLVSKVQRGLRKLTDGYQILDCTDFDVKTVEAASWLLHYRIRSAQAGYDRLLPNFKRWSSFWRASR